jgi:hypothetical protein
LSDRYEARTRPTEHLERLAEDQRALVQAYLAGYWQAVEDFTRAARPRRRRFRIRFWVDGGEQTPGERG